MFGCALYPVEGAMIENIRQEAIDNIKRLRNYGCIALWCGNNECYDTLVAGKRSFEKKGIELTTPSTLPAGATCFGIRYGGAFSCDDYNIDTAYVGQTVTPELVLEIATESETVVDVATGTEIGY